MLTLVQRLNRPAVAMIAVAAIAGGLRLWHLSSPPDLVFDEFYYAKAGCILIGGSNKTCMVDSSTELYWRAHKWDVGSWVHPPLGKWTVGLGEKLFGITPFGWRFPSAVAGTATCVIVAGIAQLLFGSALWTFVAGFLLAVENLNFVHSRTALLDIHLEFWIVLGFLFLLLDRRWMQRRTPPEPEPEEGAEPGPDPPRPPSPLWRPWRYAAGIALGASFAVKWSGAMAIAGAILLSFMWETTRRRREGVSYRRAFARMVARESFGLAVAFLVLPIGVYLLVYLPWFHHFGWSLRAWWENQKGMWQYERSLRATAYDPATQTYTPTHAYYSNAWTWLLMLRPVNLFSRSNAGGIRQVLGIGNPAIFWGSLWVLPYLAVNWLRRRDWRAGFLVVAALANYLPWFLVSRPEFFFYVLPMTPFLVLGATYVLKDLSEATIVLHDRATGERIESSRHPYRPFACAYIVAAAALLAWFYPVLTAHWLSTTAWRARVWFRGWV